VKKTEALYNSLLPLKIVSFDDFVQQSFSFGGHSSRSRRKKTELCGESSIAKRV